MNWINIGEKEEERERREKEREKERICHILTPTTSEAGMIPIRYVLKLILHLLLFFFLSLYVLTVTRSFHL